MNMRADKKFYLRLTLSLFILFLGITYWETAINFIKRGLSSASPIFLGLAMAYILNILMSFYERHYFTKRKQTPLIQKSRRGVCLVAAIITFAFISTVIIWLVIPELVSCIKLLIAEIPTAIDKILTNENIKDILPENILSGLYSVDWKAQISENAKALTNGLSTAAGTIFSAVSSISSGIVTFFIGLVFSIYMLLGKEKLQSMLRRLFTAFIPDRINNRLFHIAEVLNESFRGYIVGQFTEAIILGTLCAVGMLIFRLPYAVMIGTLIGFTALIPVAGAYIGAIIGAVMIFTVSPVKALIFIAFIIVLQQLEGNLIYPRVVGKSIGLPALVVLSAVTIGGKLAGIGGMLVGVPIASAIYRIVGESIHRREAECQEIKTSEQNISD